MIGHMNYSTTNDHTSNEVTRCCTTSHSPATHLPTVSGKLQHCTCFSRCSLHQALRECWNFLL